MAVELILPRVDMDMTVGKMGQWFFDEGASVEKGQPLFEIETDKAAMEIEAPASGVLRGVCAQPGDELPVGSVVGWIYGAGEAYDGPPAPRAAAPAPASVQEHIATPASETPAQSSSPGLRATPAARRLAREAGADLSRIAGSGPQGRVQAGDVASPGSPLTAAPLADGASLHRLWLARGQGIPLVLIHGFGADLNGWRPMLAHLPGDRPALALDLPGHGASPLAGAPDFEAMVDAAEATLAAEGIGAAHLIGHSLGAAVAGALAARASARARSLMLIAPAGLGPDINAAFLDGFLRAQSEASLAPWLRLLADDAQMLGSAMAKTTLRQRADLGVGVAQAKIAAAFFPDGAQVFSIRDRLARIAIPAKVVFGLDDQIIPARHTRGLPGGIGLHLFSGVGHMPHFEARAALARLAMELAASGD